MAGSDLSRRLPDLRPRRALRNLRPLPFLLWAGVLGARPGDIAAQAAAVIEGRVAAASSGDTVGRPGVRVVLHRVGRALQGPLDSSLAGPGGRFAFRFRPDSLAVYILSARHAGIEYFSEPLLPDTAAPARVLILVADTSSTAPVGLVSRVFLAGAPAADSVRTLLDVLVLDNLSGLTRVPADSLVPTWALGGLPDVAVRIEEGTEFSPDAVVFRNDSVLLFAPVSPGRRQIVLGYRLPLGQRSLGIVFDRPVAELAVLAEEPALRVDAPALTEGALEVIQGQSVRRWTGRADQGDVLRFGFPPAGGRRDTRVVLALLVTLTAAALVAGFLLAQRRARPPGGPAPIPPEAELLDQLVRLEAEYRGREALVSPEEWAEYRARRDQLKAQLAGTLAGWSRGA